MSRSQGCKKIIKLNKQIKLGTRKHNSKIEPIVTPFLIKSNTSKWPVGKVTMTYIMDERIWPLSLQKYLINTTAVDERIFRNAEMELADIGKFISGACDLDDGDVIYTKFYNIPNANNWVKFMLKFCF